MSKLTIKKALAVTTLSLALSFQLTGSASAASLEQRWAASQAGIAYLTDNQDVDGNVGGWSDWAVVAAAASGLDQDELTNGGVSAVDYLLANPLTAASSATDVERRMLAIVAAGQDPADFGGVNYVELLATYYNNGQIGDTSLLSDDIFGLMAIIAADDASLGAMAQDALEYLLANQEGDGGFGWATSAHPWYEGSDSNDTAAALVALMASAEAGLVHPGLEDAFVKAVPYLLGTQQNGGGFGYNMIYAVSDGGSTAWALIALNGLGTDFDEEAGAAHDWIIGNQNDDGGFNGFVGSDVQTTTHSVIALLGTTWLLQPEPLQEPAAPAQKEEPDTTPTPTVTVTPGPKAEEDTPEVTTSTTTESEPTPEVLQAETGQTAGPTPATVEKETAQTENISVKKPNYTLYGGIVLLLVAIAWFVIQSKSKQGKS